MGNVLLFYFICGFPPYHFPALVFHTAPQNPDNRQISPEWLKHNHSRLKSNFSEIGGMISVYLYTMVTYRIKYLPSSWCLTVKQNVLPLANFIRSAILLALFLQALSFWRQH